MANYFFTETAKFKPFSYQEMLAPIVAYKDAYDAADAQLGALEDTAATQAFTFQGSKYENQYNEYINRLTAASESLSSGNSNPTETKKKIRTLRREYLDVLAPAAQRITKLNTLRDKQNAEQANNPYIRFSTDYRNMDEDQVNNSSNYTSYDLSKIYTQVVKDTISRISSDYRPQVGDPMKVEGTNSYIIKHGYGMTPEEYEEALNTPNSDLNKYINSQVAQATKGITNEDVIKEITQGVKDTIKSNIGKFEQTIVKGDKSSSESNANFFRAAEAAYRYNWGTDSKGNPIILGESDQYKLDHGWQRDINGNWYKPSSRNGNKEEKDTIDPYYDLKTMPASQGGTIEINNTDIDNKLRKTSNKPDVSVVIEGKKKAGLKKYEWYELYKLGVKGLDSDEIAYFTDNNIDNAKYYDYYYEDTGGRGGKIHIVRKKDAEIEDIMVFHRSNEKKKEATGIVRKNGKYYFADSQGKILLNPRYKGIQLDLVDINTRKELIAKLGNKDGYISFDGTTITQQSQQSSDNNSSNPSSEVAVD